MTTEQAVAKLQAACDREGLREMARRLEYDPGNLCHVLNHRKDPEFVLRKFGYERVISYRKIRP